MSSQSSRSGTTFTRSSLPPPRRPAVPPIPPSQLRQNQRPKSGVNKSVGGLAVKRPMPKSSTFCGIPQSPKKLSPKMTSRIVQVRSSSLKNQNSKSMISKHLASIETDRMVAALKGPNGVEVKDRTYRLKKYPSCFVGADFVRWMIKHNYANNNQDAIEKGDMLMQRDVFKHFINNKKNFEDGQFFYHFNDFDAETDQSGIMRSKSLPGGPRVGNFGGSPFASYASSATMFRQNPTPKSPDQLEVKTDHRPSSPKVLITKLTQKASGALNSPKLLGRGPESTNQESITSSPPIRAKKPPDYLKWAKKYTTKGNRGRYPYINQTDLVKRYSDCTNRLADYFFIFSRGEIKNELSDVNSLFDISFSPMLKDKYPDTEWEDCPCPPNLFMFVFPQDIQLLPYQRGRVLERKYQPKAYHFVLTKIDGGKQYAICLQFFQELYEKEINDLICELEEKYKKSQAEKGKAPNPNFAVQLHKELVENNYSVFEPRAICILSEWPYYIMFTEILTSLYQISLAPTTIPIERYIANFMFEVPLPPEGGICVSHCIADKAIFFSHQGPYGIPCSQVNFLPLFQCLEPSVILALYAAIATEQKIVMSCSNWWILVSIAEAFRALLFPFVWQGVYMPILPIMLEDFLYSPVPFIAGISTVYWDGAQDWEGDVCLLNIDKNELWASADAIPTWPSKEKKKLLADIKMYANVFQPNFVSSASHGFGEAFPDGYARPIQQVSHSSKTAGVLSPLPSEVSLSRYQSCIVQSNNGFSNKKIPEKFKIAELRESFLDFWVSMLSKHKDYLVQNEDEPFDEKKFIADLPKSKKPLMTGMMETQCFSVFALESIGHDREDNPEKKEYIDFFRACIARRMDRKKTNKGTTNRTRIHNDHEITQCFTSIRAGRHELKEKDYIYAHGYDRLEKPLFENVRDIMNSEVRRYGPKKTKGTFSSPKIVFGSESTQDFGELPMALKIRDISKMLAFDAKRTRQLTTQQRQTHQVPLKKKPLWKKWTKPPEEKNDDDDDFYMKTNPMVVEKGENAPPRPLKSTIGRDGNNTIKNTKKSSSENRRIEIDSKPHRGLQSYSSQDFGSAKPSRPTSYRKAQNLTTGSPRRPPKPPRRGANSPSVPRIASPPRVPVPRIVPPPRPSSPPHTITKSPSRPTPPSRSKPPKMEGEYGRITSGQMKPQECVRFVEHRWKTDVCINCGQELKNHKLT